MKKMRNDVYELERFLEAQESDYENALEEIRNGYKQGHWIWYIFPQIYGLGHSRKSQYYAIKDREEAKAYIEHPVLGQRLIEISNELLSLDSGNAKDVMGDPDDRKLKSCMTLFSLVSDNPVFQKILDKFFNGEKDKITVSVINRETQNANDTE